MKPSTTTRLLLLAAVTAAVPSAAFAQFQVDNSRANDANNRIGSGGYNSGGIPAPETVNGNQIVTGNVTGAKAFRGPVGYTAPNEFSGNSATANYDRRNRDFSAPQVSYNQTRPNYGNAATPFYTSVSNPPAGFVQTPGGSGFVPGQPSTYNPTRYDERLGVMTDAPTDSYVPRRGQLLLPGPVDASANQTFISASPLYGVRQFSVGDPAAAGILGAGAMDASARGALSDDQITRMRRELSQTLNNQDLQSLDNGKAPGQAPTPGTPQPLNSASPTSFDAPENNRLTGKALNNSALASTANDITTGQGQEDRFLAPPTIQSTQYAEMRRRLDRYNAQQQKSPEELNKEFHAQFRAAEQKKEEQQKKDAAALQAATPKKPADRLAGPDLGARARDLAEGKIPTEHTGGSATLVQNATGGTTASIPSTPDIGPVDVRSLATGVKAPGLRNILQQAELLMRDGKYDSAATQYESAAQVAPNNPMILLGQSNAELGGEYFARAENHLRQAFLIDPTLLMARYDLRAMIGDKRLDEIINSLKAIASKETTQSRPAFLLSYIAYNSRDTGRAASYLDLAEKRSSGPDPVFRLLRSHWSLPAAPTAAEPKK